MLSRIEKRRAKSRFKRNLLLVCVATVCLGIAYVVYQYNSGKSLADDSFLNKNEPNPDFKEFEASDPQFGEMNVLLIGSDARPGEHGLSDTLMIGHYNQKTNDIKLISIMRDIYVDIPDHGKQKMNAAYAFGGPELVRKTLKENFDIDVHYYAIVDFNAFPKLVDIIAPDGIKVDIPYTMSHGIGMTLEKGEQVLKGDQLLGYVRFRHDAKSDFGRVERQQEVLSKMKEQAISVHNLINLPKILGLAESYIETNVDHRTILTIGKGLLKERSETIETLRIPIDGSYTPKRESVGDVLVLDFEQNKEALKQFLEGEVDEKTAKVE